MCFEQNINNVIRQSASQTMAEPEDIAKMETISQTDSNKPNEEESVTNTVDDSKAKAQLEETETKSNIEDDFKSLSLIEGKETPEKQSTSASPETPEGDRRCASGAGESEYESFGDGDESKEVDDLENNTDRTASNSPTIVTEEVSDQKSNEQDNIEESHESSAEPNISNETKCENENENQANIEEIKCENEVISENKVNNENEESHEQPVTVKSNEDDSDVKIEESQTLLPEEKNEEDDDENENYHDLESSEESEIDEQINEDDDSGGFRGSNADDEGITGEESNDGEEEGEPCDKEEEGEDTQPKYVDHDEDKRNPQYIPKKGAFYEHDDRTVGDEGAEVAEDEESTTPTVIDDTASPKILKKPEVESENRKPIRKKLWNEDGKWGHDLFKDDEQTPKSRDELVQTYGYDIRNEDDAPKARRRRRYGRGPNKYTRQWQDEDAYGKLRSSPFEKSERNPLNEPRVERGMRHSNRDRDFEDKRERRFFKDRRPREIRDKGERRQSQANRYPNQSDNRKRYEEQRKEGFSNEDFPELPSSGKKGSTPANAGEGWKRPPRQKQEEYKTEPMKVIEAIENSNRNLSDPRSLEVVRTQTFENSRYYQRRSHEGDDKSGRRTFREPAGSGRPIKKASNLASNTRDDRDYRKANSNRNERDSKYHDDYPQNNFNDNFDEKSNRLADSEQSRPKRYSSLRQQQQHRSAPNENVSQVSSNESAGNIGNQSQYYEAATHIEQHSPRFYQDSQRSAPRYGYIPPAGTEPQPSHSPQFIPPQMQPPRYLPQQVSHTPPQTQSGPPPTVMGAPPQFLPTFGPPSGYPQYPPAPAGLPAGLPSGLPSGFHALPPGPPPVPPPPPPQATVQQLSELYRGGVTYYDTHSQQHSPRQVPQRRPKAAIPIVPPPEPHGEGDVDNSYVSVNS